MSRHFILRNLLRGEASRIAKDSDRRSLHADLGRAAHAERIGAGAAEIDTAATDERPAIGHNRIDRAAVGEIGDRHAAAKRQRLVCDRERRPRERVEPGTGRRAAAVVAVADAVLRGNADLGRDRARDKTGERERRGKSGFMFQISFW
ncbi:hypothetical protein J2R70_004003 [Bradyrhizobium japonicum]|nr:hypothetical protein [Bradyrhizobium japonicum]MCP1891114.1 hypothetical protein [Bradyrhizobium japonicum]